MSLTLIMTWDIKEDMDQEYFEFVVREWVPATSRIGLQMIAAWYTYYRKDESVPRIRAEGITETIEEMRAVLENPEWDDIQARLMEYVENYKQKIVYTTGEFKL